MSPASEPGADGATPGERVLGHPAAMVLREGPWPIVPRLLVALVAAGIGVLLATGALGAAAGWSRALAVALALAASVAVVTYLVMMLRPQQLVVYEDHLELRGVRGVARRIPLAEVAVFARPTGVHSRLVGYRLNGVGRRAREAGDAHTQQATDRARHGVDVLLPSTQAYGVPPDELVDELNARLIAARRRHGPPG